MTILETAFIYLFGVGAGIKRINVELPRGDIVKATWSG
jgi:hypothetical protein